VVLIKLPKYVQITKFRFFLYTYMQDIINSKTKSTRKDRLNTLKCLPGYLEKTQKSCHIKVLIKKFIIAKFVFAKMVIANFVIARFVITELVIIN